MAKESKITLHMVSSLDGFIARPDGDISWMHSTDTYAPGKTLTEEYITEFLSTIDCYVMGSKTYEHALELGWPYGDKPVFVLTNRNLKTDRANVKFYSGDLDILASKQLRHTYRNIWVVGGSMLVKDFLRLRLADEIVISVIPIILGEGLLFFDYIGQEIPLRLKDSTAYSDGMVELTYEIKKA